MSDADKKKAIESILTKLSSSIRGQVFLCNLHSSIEDKMIAPNVISKVFSSIQPRDIKNMHENALLGHLRALFQDPKLNLTFQHKRKPVFSNFTNDLPLLTIFTLKDFDSYYKDSDDAITGHDFYHNKVGSSTNNFSASATTNNVCWVTPSNGFPKIEDLVNASEYSRDVLGLVHIGKDIPLVVMHFIPKTNKCFQPTTIESIPNERFKQSDENEPYTEGWGYTVNLDLLDSAPTNESIRGNPELIIAQFKLKSCKSICFYYLGKTITDRDTTSSDIKFLNNLLAENNIDTICSNLESKLL